MRVIVATTMWPFVRGGAEYMTDSLCSKLAEAGHAVERFDLPFTSYYRTMPSEMLGLRLIDLTGHGDRLITIRTPSYLIRHHSKVVWFIHHHRPAFDLWGTEFQDVPRDCRGAGYREAFRSADNLALRECKSVFVNSNRMASRVKEFNGLETEVLYPPLRGDSGLYPGSYGNYILCAGRIVRSKRQHLCVEAMRYVKTPVRLLIAGPPDTLEYLERVEASAPENVSVVPGWLEEMEKAELFARSLAVVYAPVDEDSYGYVTLEAAEARKAVVTCSDSGGILEFVEDGKSGLVAEPEPEALAECFDRLWVDRIAARRLGEGAYHRRTELHICWDHVLSRLLA